MLTVVTSPVPAATQPDSERATRVSEARPARAVVGWPRIAVEECQSVDLAGTGRHRDGGGHGPAADGVVERCPPAASPPGRVEAASPRPGPTRPPIEPEDSDGRAAGGADRDSGESLSEAGPRRPPHSSAGGGGCQWGVGRDRNPGLSRRGQQSGLSGSGLGRHRPGRAAVPAR